MDAIETGRERKVARLSPDSSMVEIEQVIQSLD
jgi:hypothetical protein